MKNLRKLSGLSTLQLSSGTCCLLQEYFSSPPQPFSQAAPPPILPSDARDYPLFLGRIRLAPGRIHLSPFIRCPTTFQPKNRSFTMFVARMDYGKSWHWLDGKSSSERCALMGMPRL